MVGNVAQFSTVWLIRVYCDSVRCSDLPPSYLTRKLQGFLRLCLPDHYQENIKLTITVSWTSEFRGQKYLKNIYFSCHRKLFILVFCSLHCMILCKAKVQLVKFASNCRKVLPSCLKDSFVSNTITHWTLHCTIPASHGSATVQWGDIDPYFKRLRWSWSSQLPVKGILQCRTVLWCSAGLYSTTRAMALVSCWAYFSLQFVLWLLLSSNQWSLKCAGR